MAEGQIVRSQANIFLEQLVKTGSSPHYIGLSTSALNVNGDGYSEPSEDNGYKRRKLDMMNPASEGMITNGDIIFFPESLGSGWGNITHFFISKNEKGGTAIFYAPLNTSVSIPAGYVPIFRTEALAIGIDRDLP